MIGYAAYAITTIIPSEYHVIGPFIQATDATSNQEIITFARIWTPMASSPILLTIWNNPKPAISHLISRISRTSCSCLWLKSVLMSNTLSSRESACKIIPTREK